ncbi:hypothetical protein MJD09_17040 [bacterium]|nr:hypothetical protein [bacterium]
MKLYETSLRIFLIVILFGCTGGDQSQNYGKFNRAELRYYAYAPPQIPHEVLNPQCMDCHGQGLVVDGFKAPVTPHPQLENCQQCHVRARDDVRPFAANSFVGQPERLKLKLPQPNGPPLIPHPVFMRENCAVCHADSTRREITQTTHPERFNCQQCHVEQNAMVTTFRPASAVRAGE